MIGPRVISLDLDDTLWPVAPVIAAAEVALLSWLRAHHPRVADGHDLDSMRTLRTRIAEQFPDQGHDVTFLRRRALTEQFAAAGYEGLSAADSHATGLLDAEPRAAGSPIDEAFEIFMRERNRVELYEDVRPALVRLRSTYRLFAVSNGNADLSRCGIADLFDGHITASAAGAAKPDTRIFGHLLRVAGLEAHEVLHIGDDPLADVVGATQAGMRAIWLNREARTWPEHFARPPRTIATLAEIM
jgi:FMN hydrolase / 5-amino-6-(5-phospho-D-ribitylamino)uracil phosphatase